MARRWRGKCWTRLSLSAAVSPWLLLQGYVIHRGPVPGQIDQQHVQRLSSDRRCTDATGKRTASFPNRYVHVEFVGSAEAGSKSVVVPKYSDKSARYRHVRNNVCMGVCVSRGDSGGLWDACTWASCLLPDLSIAPCSGASVASIHGKSSCCLYRRIAVAQNLMYSTVMSVQSVRRHVLCVCQQTEQLITQPFTTARNERYAGWPLCS